MRVKVVQVSDVEASGKFAVFYQIVEDDRILYDNLTVYVSTREDFVNSAQARVAEIKSAKSEANTIQVGEEISLGS